MLIGFYLRSETSLPSIEGHLHFTLEHREYTFLPLICIERTRTQTTYSPPPWPVSPSGWWPRPWSRWSPGTACPRARSIVCIWPAGVISSYQVTPWPHIVISSYIMASSYRCHCPEYNISHITHLALPAGAEVQLPGGLLPVDVGDVLGRGAAQPPPRPAPIGVEHWGHVTALSQSQLTCCSRGCRAPSAGCCGTSCTRVTYSYTCVDVIGHV